MAVIALIDCNNFFVSCEQLADPNLLNKPVCVLSNNDGCVVSRSKEAKDLGVTMGMPHFMAKRQFRNVYYLSGRIGLYQNISARIMAKLRTYTPNVEQYSIDEAFLDLTGLNKLYKMPYDQIIKKIQDEIKDEIGIPVSIGLSYSKILAKLASEKGKKGNGLYIIGHNQIEDELKKTRIQEIWGIGKNTTATCHKYGIYTASDIVKQNEFWLKKIWGKRGQELKSELLGRSVYAVVNEETLPKSIQRTSSFPEFTNSKTYIKNSLRYHSHKVCSKMRRLGLKCETVHVMLRTKDFRVFTEKVTLPQLADSEFIVNKYIDTLFEKIYNSGITYRSSGVYAEKLTPKETVQMNLFSSQEDKKAQILSKVWDSIEQKHGRHVFSIGVVNY